MATGFLTPTGVDPEEVDRRKKFAQSLLMAGTDISPVRHPLQAVARALQGAMGGYLQYKADEESKAEQAKAMAGLMAALGQQPMSGAGIPPSASLPPTGPAPAMPPSAPGMPPIISRGPGGSPLMPSYNGEPPRPVVQSSPTIVGDAEGIRAGIYEDTPAGATLPPSVVSQVPPRAPMAAPRVPQAAPTMPAAAGGLPPNIGPMITALSNPWLGKGGQAIASSVLGSQLKPRDQWVQVTLPDGTPAQQNLTNGEIKPQGDNKDLAIINDIVKNPKKYGFTGLDDPNLLETVRKRAGGQATSVSVNNVAEPVLEGIGKQVVDQRHAAYSAATTIIPQIHEARRAIDAGAITGAFAGGRLDLNRIGALFGLSGDAVANTEVFRAAAGNQVLADAKALGANPSNTDRDYIEKVKGGRIELNQETIYRLLEIQERLARQAIRNFNASGQKLINAAPERYRAVQGLMTQEEPPEYEPERKVIGNKTYYRRGGQWFEEATP